MTTPPLPTAVDEPDAPPDRPTGTAMPGGEGMLWAVKSSLLRYVSQLPDGHAAITAGASLIGPLLHFPYLDSNDIDEATGAAQLRFGGSVRLLGHVGLLDFPISYPWITVSDNGSGHISMLSGADERITALQFAGSTFHTDAATVGWDVDCSRPTPDGIALFGHSYTATDEFDPVHVRITRPRVRSHPR